MRGSLTACSQCHVVGPRLMEPPWNEDLGTGIVVKMGALEWAILCGGPIAGSVGCGGIR